jgi:hypothetical protein
VELVFQLGSSAICKVADETCNPLIILPPVSGKRRGKTATKKGGDPRLTLREAVVADLDALHRREHRDGRRQDPVSDHHTGA